MLTIVFFSLYIFPFFILSSSFRINRMWQIGHRGFPDKYGDNNMVSFLKAHEAGFDMIELDIQLCQTGEIVVYHDTWINDQYINETPYEKLKDFNMVLLDDVFEAFVNTKMMLFLDIKGSEKVVDPLKFMIDKWFSRVELHRIYISGFNRKFVKELKQPHLRYHLGFTTENTFSVDQLDFLCKDMDFVCLHWTALDKEAVDFLHAKGILVFTYTCKDEFILKHMLDYDIDGIVSNYFITDKTSSPSLTKRISTQSFGSLFKDSEFQSNFEFGS